MIAILMVMVIAAAISNKCSKGSAILPCVAMEKWGMSPQMVAVVGPFLLKIEMSRGDVGEPYVWAAWLMRQPSIWR